MLRDKVLETIKKYNLIEENDVIVVAVSGGPDSMCLLDNLVYLKEELKIKEIVVAHLNHMLRKEAKEETKYVEEYCKNKNIKCFVKFVDINKIAKSKKIGTEEAGRIERYKLFEEVALNVNANKIAIAHNCNDSVETVFMHLLRGSGITGLCGIKPYREGKFIRPLIKCTRDEIEDYCSKEKLNPKFDKTNNDNAYTRNKIRNEFIPYIKKEFNPNIINTIDRLSELISKQEEYMEKITLEEYNKIVIKENLEKEKSQNEYYKVKLDLKKFNSLEYLLKSRVVLYAIKEIFGSTNQIEKKHVEDIIKLCQRNIGNKYLTPNKNLKVSVKNKIVCFEKI